MKALIYLAMIATASAGNNVLLIIADDFGTDSQSLYNTTAGATAPPPLPEKAFFSVLTESQ